jgi:hypothetical protein
MAKKTKKNKLSYLLFRLFQDKNIYKNRSFLIIIYLLIAFFVFVFISGLVLKGRGRE